VRHERYDFDMRRCQKGQNIALFNTAPCYTCNQGRIKQMVYTAVPVLGGYPFGTMQNVGIDNGTGACRECDFAKRCGMDQLSPVNIKDFNGFVPVPGIESLLIFLKIQTSTDIWKVRMKLRKQFF